MTMASALPTPIRRRFDPGETWKGIVAIVTAATLWGVSGIYFDMIADVPVTEILAHRVIWTALFFLGVFALQKRLGTLRKLLTNRGELGWLALASLFVAANWVGYVWAVQNGFATQASLGYYVFPLLAVGLGFVVFGERFTRAQIAAIGLTLAAVLALSVGLGTPPWVALLIAGAFGVYGMLSKRMPVGPLMAVGGEAVLLLLVAVPFVVWLHLQGTGAFHAGAGQVGLLTLSAAFTGLPLFLFSYAAKRLSYATLGLLQYLNPTLQFAVAMLYFREGFGAAHAVAFPLIWAGVAIYCIDLVRQERRRSDSMRSSTVSATSTCSSAEASAKPASTTPARSRTSGSQ